MLNATLRAGFETDVQRPRTISENTKSALDKRKAITEEGESLVGSLSRQNAPDENAPDEQNE